MLKQASLPDLFNVTSSLDSAAGATPCALPDGPRIDLFGRAVARASLLAQPVPGVALPTNAISGLPGSISSASADLTLSLVSKLKQRLTTDGSTLFSLTWREKVTPAGRLVYRLAASGRRTSDSDFGLWPTTTVTDAYRGERYDPMAKNITLNMAAQRTSWVSPRAQDGERGGEHERGVEMGGGRSTAQRGATGHQLDRTDTTDSQLADDLDTRLQGRLPGGGAINFWSDCDWLPCIDGKARPVEPGTFPLAHGVSGRVGRLRAYGNAIVPQVAQTFIEAYLES